MVFFLFLIMQNSQLKIGVFDSGVGGLTVFKQVRELLPYESYLYFADSANAPYGNMPVDDIIQRSKKISDFFIEKGVKLIVVACNTATAAAIDWLRENYEVPFVGMEPAVKPASLMTKTGNIGILATKGTLGGKLFKEKEKIYGQYINIHYTEGKGLVEIAESSAIDSPETDSLLRSLIEPMLEKSVDHIVLGCTHYPLFKEKIQAIAGDQVTLIDPADAIARRVKDVLIQNASLCTNQNHTPLQCFSNGSDTLFKSVFYRCLGDTVPFDLSKITW